MHQDFSPRDVAEGEERVDRHVLEPRQTMARHIEDGNRSISPGGSAGPEVIRMGPIGHVIQVVVPARGIIGLMFSQQRGGRRGAVRVTGAVRRMDGRVSTSTVEAMSPMRVILDPCRNIGILGRFPVRHDDDKRFAAAHLRGRRRPGGRVVAPEKVRIRPAGVGDIAGPCRADSLPVKAVISDAPIDPTPVAPKATPFEMPPAKAMG